VDDEFIGIYVKGGCRLHLNGIVACREQRAHEHSACAVGTWLRVWAVQDEFTALPRLPLWRWGLGIDASNSTPYSAPCCVTAISP
jgi:hypothetical protein